jgi:hypothetical protein
MTKNSAFTHQVSRDILERSLALSPTDKIRWLCRAKRFTYRYVSPDKIRIWQELKRRRSQG